MYNFKEDLPVFHFLQVQKTCRKITSCFLQLVSRRESRIFLILIHETVVGQDWVPLKETEGMNEKLVLDVNRYYVVLLTDHACITGFAPSANNSTI